MTLHQNGFSNAGTMNPEELLKERDLKIAALERSKQRQDEELAELRRELGASEVHQKEELYWLRMDLDNLRREKEDVEDRIDTVYRDIQSKSAENCKIMEEPASVNPEYVINLQAEVEKSSRTQGILELQTAMVKKSCDDVINSLKQEILDVNDDKIRMEMDLLNQLASCDTEKRELEMDFEEQIKFRDDKISDMKRGIGIPDASKNSSEKNKEEDMINAISALRVSKKKLEDELNSERQDSDEAIARLEEANIDLEQQIESMTSDLEVMRQGAAAEAVQVLDALTRERQETLTTLERVAMIWEKADDSIQGLEGVVDELRPRDDDDAHGDRDYLLSTLETGSLVHGQIRAYRLLVELKLRNQLSSLKNDKLSMGSESIPAHGVTERMKEIQQEALTALDQVEESLEGQIKELENLTREETANVKGALKMRTEELRNMQSQHRRLEAEISRMRAEEDRRRAREDDELSGSSGTAVSRSVLESFHSEVLTVAERVREKNNVIDRLQTSIEENKVREATLEKAIRETAARERMAARR